VKKGGECGWLQVVIEARFLSDSVQLICYKQVLAYLLICMYVKGWARIHQALSLLPTRSITCSVFPYNYLLRITSLYLGKRILYVWTLLHQHEAHSSRSVATLQVWHRHLFLILPRVFFLSWNFTYTFCGIIVQLRSVAICGEFSQRIDQ
jgi:hypothetical protein